jgi:hypothetical protein
MAESKPASTGISQVAKVLRLPGETLASFSAQWKALPDSDKEQLRQGVLDGTLTY